MVPEGTRTPATRGVVLHTRHPYDHSAMAYCRERHTMRITITSVFVNDQESALTFYTDVLGVQVKHNVPMGKHA